MQIKINRQAVFTRYPGHFYQKRGFLFFYPYFEEVKGTIISQKEGNTSLKP